MVSSRAAAFPVHTNSNRTADGLFASPRTDRKFRSPPPRDIKPSLQRQIIF